MRRRRCRRGQKAEKGDVIMVGEVLRDAGRKMRIQAGRAVLMLAGVPKGLAVRFGGRRASAHAAVLREEEGQGTTEYAILVGVLVVIAIAAIALFRGRIQSLWDSIATAINGL